MFLGSSNKKLVPCSPKFLFCCLPIHLFALLSVACVSQSCGALSFISVLCFTCLSVKASREVQVSDITENSARLRWDRPEPPSPYFYDLTVTSAHDQSLVLRQNLSVTERAIGGLLAGHTYHIAVVCYLKSQVRATYQGSFSTSEYTVSPEHSAPDFHVQHQTGHKGDNSDSLSLK